MEWISSVSPYVFSQSKKLAFRSVLSRGYQYHSLFMFRRKNLLLPISNVLPLDYAYLEQLYRRASKVIPWSKHLLPILTMLTDQLR